MSEITQADVERSTRDLSASMDHFFATALRIKNERDELLDALTWLVRVVDKAGVNNLANGVQLGAISWSVKMTDAMECARGLISKATSQPPSTVGER